MIKYKKTLLHYYSKWIQSALDSKVENAEFNYSAPCFSVRIYLKTINGVAPSWYVFVHFKEKLPRDNYCFSGDFESNLFEQVKFLDYLEKHFMFTL